MNECVDILADKLYKGGKIQDKCEEAGFYERLILLEKQFKGASVLMHKLGYLPTGFRNLWSNERLLNVVEQLIGPDIAGKLYKSHELVLIPSPQVIQFGTLEPRHHAMSKPQCHGIRTMPTWIPQHSTHSCPQPGSPSSTQTSTMAACR